MADDLQNALQSKHKVHEDGLAQWITSYVTAWEQWRDNNYKDRWDSYYRMYRGLWTGNDKTRESERSRIMGTELAQAIETAAAEIEDAVFAKDRWIGLVDDVADEEKEDMEQYLKLLLDEYDMYGAKASLSEIILNGAIYGTGIGKLKVEKVDVPNIGNDGVLPYAEKQTKYCVKLVSVSPRNFVIDPNARTVDDGLGCAHVWAEPMSDVQKKIASGYYKPFSLGSYQNSVEDKASMAEVDHSDEHSSMCKIVEWHGLVPESMMNDSDELLDELASALEQDEDSIVFKTDKNVTGQENMVEAIITIVNDAHVARKVKNPFIFGDRSFMAYQHDTVPDRFWGRGVAEKGFNPQKALDAEIRARIDALGFSVNPMMGMDSTKMPRGETYKSKPGKTILTIGPPMESLAPIKFPPPDPHTFQQTQELREMIQRGTGSYELPQNVDNSRMAATSMSMVVGSMIKRSRRTLANLERNMLTPLVKKSLWRYMQFDADRFPMVDYKFKVVSAMGIMAREFEQGQLVSLLSTVPGESPAFWMLMKSIYELSNTENRDQMVSYAEQMLEKSLNPEPPPPDPAIELEREKMQLDLKVHQDKMDIEARKLMQQDEMIAAEASRDEGEGRMQTATAILQLVKAETEQLRAQAESMLNVSKAHAEQAKQELERVKLEVEAAKEQAATAAEEERKRVAAIPETVKGDLEPILGTFTESIATQIADLNKRLDEATPQTDIQEVMKQVESDREIAQAEQEDLMDMVAALQEQLAAKEQEAGEEGLSEEDDALAGALEGGAEGLNIERDESGLVVAVNGRKVKRDDSGLIAGIE